MSQERLVGLSLISVEYQILQKNNLDQIIKDFAEKKRAKCYYSSKLVIGQYISIHCKIIF